MVGGSHLSNHVGTLVRVLGAADCPAGGKPSSRLTGLSTDLDLGGQRFTRTHVLSPIKAA